MLGLSLPIRKIRGQTSSLPSSSWHWDFMLLWRVLKCVCLVALEEETYFGWGSLYRVFFRHEHAGCLWPLGVRSLEFVSTTKQSSPLLLSQISTKFPWICLPQHLLFSFVLLVSGLWMTRWPDPSTCFLTLYKGSLWDGLRLYLDLTDPCSRSWGSFGGFGC